MSTKEIREYVRLALAAARDRKAEDITLLELPKESSAFTDYFLICSGTNPRQVQAIADSVDEALSKAGQEPAHREGYKNAEWVLLDYVDFVVHIFGAQSRRFYDLERLWKSAQQISEEDLKKSPKPEAPAKKAARPVAKKAASKRTAAAKKSSPRPGTKTAAKKTAKKAARRR
ncbi:MAG TPA: ribosome silencing factor [Clostridia bacterium]|nr:ribosome silencing factor [Clostridia bacterium]